MADEPRAPLGPNDPLVTPETTETAAGARVSGEAARDAATNEVEAARQVAQDAELRREAAEEVAADIAHERDLAAATANRMAAERNAAATVASVESSAARENAFGFWLMVGIVAVILVVGIIWAGTTRPWQTPPRDLDVVVPAQPMQPVPPMQPAGPVPPEAPAPPVQPVQPAQPGQPAPLDTVPEPDASVGPAPAPTGAEGAGTAPTDATEAAPGGVTSGPPAPSDVAGTE